MIESRDWRAVRDGSRLRVVGTCVFPTSGFGVELRRHEPQEAQEELLLDLVESMPTGPVLQVITEEQVAYEEADAEGCERVSILPDGPRGLPVETSSYY
jgi:hypothetical protein